MKILLQVEVYKLKRTKIILITTILTLLALYQGYDFAKMGIEEKADEVFRGFLYQGSMAVYSWLVLPLDHYRCSGDDGENGASVITVGNSYCHAG